MPSTSSALAFRVPICSPRDDRCTKVRDVVNPIAPARTASSQSCDIRSISSGDAAAFDVRAAVAHHIGAERGVRNLGADVDGPAHRVEHVEVLGERLPSPRHALGECGARNVLDAFEQTDEPFVTIRRNGSESHPAVAEQHRRDAVDRRRREVGVPGDLAVVVGVDVDPARRDDQARRVDLAATGTDRARLPHLGDGLGVDRHVCRPARAARPVDDDASANHEIMHDPTVVLATGRPPEWNIHRRADAASGSSRSSGSASGRAGPGTSTLTRPRRTACRPVWSSS